MFYLNGEDLSNSKCVLELDLINHLGQGAFETFLIQKHVNGFFVRGLSLHLNRLELATTYLGLKSLNLDQIHENLRKIASKLTSFPARIRLINLPQNLIIQVENYQQVECFPIKLASIKSERTLPQIKSCSALASLEAQRQAKNLKADEALLVDRLGLVRECAWSNFFWIDQNDQVITPANHILNGVTRELILQNAPKILNQNIKIQDFSYSDIFENIKAGFVTQATSGVRVVASLDSKQLQTAHSSVQKIMQEFLGWGLEGLSFS